MTHPLTEAWRSSSDANTGDVRTGTLCRGGMGCGARSSRRPGGQTPVDEGRYSNRHVGPSVSRIKHCCVSAPRGAEFPKLTARRGRKLLDAMIVRVHDVEVGLAVHGQA